MSNITCRSCGKRYDYLNSDLCPHCGAYNKPTSRLRVDFNEEGSAELLNEQQFQQQSKANRQRKDCYEHQADQHDGIRTKTQTGKPVVKTAVLLTAAIVSAALILSAVLHLVVIRTIESDYPDHWDEAEEPAQEITGDDIFYYDMGDQFVIDGQPVMVEAVRIDEGQTFATVYWENDPGFSPKLYVQYDNGSELAAYTWEETDMGEGRYQYEYSDDGFGWEDVSAAYLIFINYGGGDEPYFEVWVDITEALCSMM